MYNTRIITKHLGRYYQITFNMHEICCVILDSYSWETLKTFLEKRHNTGKLLCGSRLTWQLKFTYSHFTHLLHTHLHVLIHFLNIHNNYKKVLACMNLRQRDNIGSLMTFRALVYIAIE